MGEGWKLRLIEMIERDPRTYVELGRAAGLSRNYVQQFIRNGKEPGAGKLMRLMKALGPGAAHYVILGVEMADENARALSALRGMPKDLAEALAPFLELAGSQKTQEPPPASEPASAAKPRTSKKP